VSFSKASKKAKESNRYKWIPGIPGCIYLPHLGFSKCSLRSLNLTG